MDPETPDDGPRDYGSRLSETRKLEARRRHLLGRVDLMEAEVAAIEVECGIDNRWQPSDFLYKQTVEYIATRRYQRALGKLQRLVIQRLFELHKLNVAKTGEHTASASVARSLTSFVLCRLQGSYLHREEPRAPMQGYTNSCQRVQRGCARTQSSTADG